MRCTFLKKRVNVIIKAVRFIFIQNHDYCARYCSSVPLLRKKSRAEGDTETYFIDWVKVKVQAGKGGDGCISFLQLWANEWAGPDGGDGGNGGHIIFQAKSNIKSLDNVRPEYLADSGGKGSNKDCCGKNAEHKTIELPIGTLIRNEKNDLLCDLNKENAIFIAAKGGAGGRGNHYFVSNSNRAPIIAEVGANGEKNVYFLELKMMAHAGFIGFPNAGKSSLLRAISRAKPKIASYPFTTLNPHVGIIHYDDYVQLSIADLPGLIHGAHKNEGLGLSFLRHVERCVCLIYVIDLSENEPWNQLTALKHELGMYDKKLIERPCAIIGNKIDLTEAQSNLKRFQNIVKLPVIPVSAKYRIGINKMLFYIRELYDSHLKAANS